VKDKAGNIGVPWQRAVLADCGNARPVDVSLFRRLVDELHQHERVEQRLRAVAEVNQAILEDAPSDDVLRLIARLARWLVGAAATTIVMPHGTGELVVRAADGLNADAVQGLSPAAVSPVAAEVMRSKRARDVTDLSREPLADQELVARGGVGPALFVPLLVRGRVIGVIQLANRKGQAAFDDDQVLTVQLFVAEAAVAVEQARLREHLRQLAMTLMLTERPLRQTLDNLARSVVEFTGTEACSIHLLEDDQRLRTVGSHGLTNDLVLGMDAAYREGAGHPAIDAITMHGPAVVDDETVRMRGDVRFSPVHDLLDEVTWSTVVCLPLIGPTATRGAMCCYFARQPGDSDVAFLKVVASEAATVIGNAQLLAAAREKVSRAERQHLARELHDSVSQALYGIALGARTIRELLDRDPTQIIGPADYVLQLADAGLADMRALIFQLRPESLELEGLAAALVKQADAVRARHGVVVETSLDDVRECSIEVQHALYRIAQEALHNAAKHANARRIEVRLHARDSTITLDVIDDGVGFQPHGEYPGHLGLRSMRERAATIGGMLHITSSPGAGTRVRFTVPFER
jgi:signal transduction histidine kinase